MWSESPVRGPEPQVRQMGVAVACSPEFPRTSLTPLAASFTVSAGAFGFVALGFRLAYTSTADVQVRIASIVPAPGDPPTDYTPTPWELLPAAPAGGTHTLISTPVAGAGSISGWVVEWDAPVVSDMCATPRDQT